MSDATTKIILDADARKLVQEFTQATNTLKNFTEEQKKSADESKGAWTGVLATWRDAAATFRNSFEVIGMAADKMRGVWDFAKEGAELAEAQKYFDIFVQSMGQSSDEFLRKMQESSGGLVTQKELMLTTMKAVRGGVTEDTDSLAKLWEIATVKADFMGVSVAEAFRQMTDAISKGASKSLIDMGFLPESFSKASDKASLLEKRTTLLSEVIKQGSEEIKKYAEVGESSADKMERLSTAFIDVREEAAKNLSDGLTPWVEYLTREGIPAIRDTVEWMNKMFLGIDNTEGYIQNLYSKNKMGALDANISKTKLELDQANKDYKEWKERAPYGWDNGQTEAKERIRNLTNQLNQLLAEKKTILEKGKESRLADAKKAQEEQQRKAESDLQNYIYTISFGFDKEEKTKKVRSVKNELKEAKEEAVDFKKALEGAFNSGQNSSASAIAPTFAQIGEKAKDATAQFLQLIPGADQFQSLISDAVKGAGLLSGNIQQAAKNVNDLISSGKVKELQALAIGISGSIIGAPVPGGSKVDVKRIIDEEEQKYKEARDREKQRQEDLVRNLHDKLQINVADAFEQGLYDGLNGGNFLESFGRGLRSQVARALSATITSQIFGVGGSGGSFNLGGMLMGSPGYASGVPDFANTVAYDPSDGSGGNVLKGGLLSGVFKPAWSDAGKFLWKNALSNVGVGLVAGYAADRLFGAGGVFGGRIENGKEAISQAGDINSQVTQALAEQKQFLQTAVGVSAETFRQIRDLKFYTAGYSWSDSGDGIFSKKTRTYALDAGAANAALTEFQRLTRQATEEMTMRTLEIQFKGLSSPLEALQATLRDLQTAIENAPDALSKRQLELQAAQTQKQISAASAQRLGDWTNFMLGNPFASFGQDAKTPVWGQIVDPAKYGLGIMSGAFNQGTGFGTYTLDNGQKITLEQFKNWADSTVMMQGLKNQSGLAYEIAAAQARGEDLSTYKFQTSPMTFVPGANNNTSIGRMEGGDLKTYQEILSGNLDYYKTIMDELEKQLQDAALQTEQRNQLFASWQAAQQAYYSAKSEQLNFEISEEAKIKAKQAKLNDDRLANALTWIGETRDQNGQTILILSGGQSDTIDRLKAIRDGLDAEGQAVINQIIDQKVATNAPRWNG